MRRLRLFAMLPVLVLAACAERGGAGDSAVAGGTSSVPLTGAGASFPYPIYSRWFNSYAQRTGTYINYQSIGSGGGIRQLAEGTVDFGASDRPLPDTALVRPGQAPVVHVPMVIGAVAIAYNVAGAPRGLRLDASTAAAIFRGEIARWNDDRIAALNPAAMLPPQDIVVVYRADGSGTSFAFTTWLGAGSPEWRDGPGVGDMVRWPVGLGARGNEGVAAQVKQTPGAIGFVELTYATQGRLAVAALRNPAGAFVRPSISSMAAAARAVVDSLAPDADYRVSLVNAPGADAYPVASFSWILVRQHLADSTKAAQIRDFLRWAVRSGAAEALALEYAPLPVALLPRVEARIASITGGTTRP